MAAVTQSQIEELEQRTGATRKTMQRSHVQRVAPKGHHSVDFYGLIHAPITNYHQITEAKAALEVEWRKLEQIPAWDMTRVKSKSQVKAEVHKAGKSVHSCTAHGLMLPQKRRA